MDTEVWLHGFPIPRQTVVRAVDAERQGFDGIMLVDSENLGGDPYVELALAARLRDIGPLTIRLRLLSRARLSIRSPLLPEPGQSVVPGAWSELAQPPRISPPRHEWARPAGLPVVSDPAGMWQR